ncbi:hypothetical protein ACOMHN_055431 [Nucella lapillus]
MEYSTRLFLCTSVCAEHTGITPGRRLGSEKDAPVPQSRAHQREQPEEPVGCLRGLLIRGARRLPPGFCDVRSPTGCLSIIPYERGYSSCIRSIGERVPRPGPQCASDGVTSRISPTDKTSVVEVVLDAQPVHGIVATMLEIPEAIGSTGVTTKTVRTHIARVFLVAKDNTDTGTISRDMAKTEVSHSLPVPTEIAPWDRTPDATTVTESFILHEIAHSFWKAVHRIQR